MIKVTSMGGNVCLPEEITEGFIEDLISDGELWWKEWFFDIRRWCDKEVEDTRVVWIRCFGIPIHVWTSEFFVSLANHFGVFICVDEHMANGRCLDVARIMVCVGIGFKTPDELNLDIDGNSFTVFLREDSYGSSMASSAGIFKTQILGPESSNSDDYLSNELQVGNISGCVFLDDNIEQLLDSEYMKGSRENNCYKQYEEGIRLKSFNSIE